MTAPHLEVTAFNAVGRALRLGEGPFQQLATVSFDVDDLQ